MCELLAMSCKRPARLTSSLTALASHASKESRLRDGWGIAYYEGRDVALFREAAAAGDSNLVRWLESSGPGSTLTIAHVRHATQGSITLANTAPFCREVGGRICVFAHNGNLPEIGSADGFQCDAYHPVGDTDSEHAFCALLRRISPLYRATDRLASIESRLETVASFAGDLRKLGPANFVFADGDALFVHADRRLQASTGKVSAPGLYRCVCPPDRELHLVRDDDSQAPGQCIVLLASVPLTETGWEPMREGEVIAVQNGEVVATRRI